MLASGDGLADRHWSCRGRLPPAFKKWPVCGIFARCGHVVLPTASRSTLDQRRPRDVGEKFASCLTAFGPGFELPVAARLKCPLPRGRHQVAPGLRLPPRLLKLSRKMTCCKVTGPVRRQRRRHVGANITCDWTACPEAASAWRIDRARRLADEWQAFASSFGIGIGNGHRRDQVSRVGV